jgi:hypothetical protein
MASLSGRPSEALQPDARTLYSIIDELRQEHSSPAAIRTLDMVVRELGETHDNLREALEHLQGQPIPPGGRRVLNELKVRAWLAGVDDLRVPPPPDEVRRTMEPIDWAAMGIAIILGGSALIAAVLAILVTISHSTAKT